MRILAWLFKLLGSVIFICGIPFMIIAWWLMAWAEGLED